ncbi:unnamed protein product [Ambrosiozyma monospora]|uniref:Unnamed protein product n=1 Tax=Ambrosiozyma monospora TaxID=43982 RepID=A0ACB5SXH1_AMBMO|nr:unnamed protein product [Ambrosiozyma monospora]
MSSLQAISHELQTFIKSRASFKLINFASSSSDIHQSQQLDQQIHLRLPLISPLTKRLLILDSSFNPPHKAHASLIVQSLLHNYDPAGTVGFATINKFSVLLLLSINNADKKTAKPAQFHHRVAMMLELANELQNNYGVAVGVGLTDKSLFVNKSKVVSEYLATVATGANSGAAVDTTHAEVTGTHYDATGVSASNPQRLPRLTFLLGFDTLVRFLNPAYYKPSSLEDSLTPFFKDSDLFILEREDGKLTLKEQNEYINKIGTGELDQKDDFGW